MKNGSKYHGVVVPVVTPFTIAGGLDRPALDRVIDLMIDAGVEGIFVLGTTGEGMHVPPQFRHELVQHTVKRVDGQVQIFGGLGDVRLSAPSEANQFFDLGVDAVVAHPPISEKVKPENLDGWFRSLLDQVKGPLLLYNMPMTTGISIPLDVVQNLLGHSKLAGIKDSENNPKRLEELMQRFGGLKDFSVFVGVGALMEKGLKLGADGIVPSVGNLIPEVCRQLCEAAQQPDQAGLESYFARMNAVASLYQKGRTLNESLAVLKAAMHCRGLCAPEVLPPLRRVSELEIEKIRSQMSELHLLNGK